MKIIDIIKQRGQTLFTVKTDTKVLDAVSIMDTKKIGALIVLDDKENVAGIISERDVLYKCYNTDTRLKDQVVEKLMTPVEEILIGKMDDTAQDLINIMLYRRIRHIPIIEKNNIVAMLTVEDILKMIMDSYEIESRLLREHIKNPFGIHSYYSTEK